jgi:hypothetical protein
LFAFFKDANNRIWFPPDLGEKKDVLSDFIDRMQPHRMSYWKMVLASLSASLCTTILAVYWLVTGEIRFPTLGRVFINSHTLYWFSLFTLVLIGLLCLMVGMGGVIALRRDARESNIR